MRKKTPSPKPQASSPPRKSGLSLPVFLPPLLKKRAFLFLLGGVFVVLAFGLFLRPSLSSRETLSSPSPPAPPLSEVSISVNLEPQPPLPHSSPPKALPPKKEEEKPSPSNTEAGKNPSLQIRDPFIYPKDASGSTSSAPRRDAPPPLPLPESSPPPLPPLPGEKPFSTPPRKSDPPAKLTFFLPPPQVLALLSSEKGETVLVLQEEDETVEVLVGSDSYGGYHYRFQDGRVVAISLDRKASYVLHQAQSGKYSWKPFKGEGKNSARGDP